MSLITLDQLKTHMGKNDMWLLIDGKVYDVTKFMDEHPGGDEVILSEGGKDATEAFEDVGHSDEARAMLPGMLVGEFEKSTLPKAKSTSSTTVNSAVEQSSNAMYFVPLVALAAYFAYRFYGQ